MEIVFMLIGFSLLMALIFLGAFFWAVRSGQYDDDITPAMRILFDDKQKDLKHAKTNMGDNSNG
jgi:cbb3-type cytochrome oxidase maturation protein